MWGYLEINEENEEMRMVGSLEFTEKEDAEEYAKGFAPDSYEWVETKEMKITYIEKLIQTKEAELQALKEKLAELNAPEPEVVPEEETPEEEIENE